ncbi:MAG: hypothetical protein QW752_05800 [Thermoplasmata archaeon]
MDKGYSGVDEGGIDVIIDKFLKGCIYRCDPYEGIFGSQGRG